MNHKFNPGDPALIIRGPNTGHSVECVVFLRPGDKAGGFEGYQGGPELANKHSEDAWIVKFSNQDVALERPRDLMPLRGRFAPEQAKSREVAA
jgi:hypothetical protein